MKIHCIGDSHSAVFSGEEKMQPVWPDRASNLIPYFESYRIGPSTAYQLHNKQSIIESVLLNPSVNENDKLMFCFGEVDIRAHLIKQSNLQNRSINDVVCECVSRYVNALLYYKKFNKEILIWGPIASWSDKKPYIDFQTKEPGPSYGSNIERNNVTKIFNQYLIDLCVENNFQFVSIFEKMLNNDGTTNPYYIMDHIHLSQNAMPLIINELKNKNIISN